MKKLNFLLVVIAVLGLTACSRNEEPIPTPPTAKTTATTGTSKPNATYNWGILQNVLYVWKELPDEWELLTVVVTDNYHGDPIPFSSITIKDEDIKLTDKVQYVVIIFDTGTLDQGFLENYLGDPYGGQIDVHTSCQPKVIDAPPMYPSLSGYHYLWAKEAPDSVNWKVEIYFDCSP